MEQSFKNVFISGLGVEQPERIVTSAYIEDRLDSVYQRLNLPKGRLEMMTGIKQRRWGRVGLKPSDLSIAAGKKAILASGIDPQKIGSVIHASVCRDFLEPATAAVVHRALKLSSQCQIFDLSNACLGWINGILMTANMIELGQIEAGIVVSGEDGRALVESTIESLKSDLKLTRKSLKPAFASLTIGSGGVAIVLTNKDNSRSNHKLIAAATENASQFNDLCQGGVNSCEDTQTSVNMQTNSEAMLHEGVALAAKTWRTARNLLNWSPGEVSHIFTHQVGLAHQRLMFEKLELDLSKDHPTLAELGNMGSASIGTGLALHADKIRAGENILLMGIGSGLVCSMLGARW